LTGSRILIVEDDDDIRRMLGIVLSGAGATVLEAATALDASVRIAGGSIDAIVLDWNLPGESGASFLERIKHDRPALFDRTLVITGDLLGREVLHDAECSGRRVLTKPFKPPEFLAALQDILDERSASL